MAVVDRFNRAISTLSSVKTIIGWFGVGGFITGIATAIAGGLWAMLNGITAPIVVMAGFCTLTAGAYLALVPMAFRVLERAQSAPIRSRPDAEIWRHLPHYRLFQAACLLADIDPNPELIKRGDAYAWGNALMIEISEGRLPIIGPNFGEATQIDRKELQKFAKMRNVRRAFLND